MFAIQLTCLAAALLCGLSSSLVLAEEASTNSALDLFDQRILPIFRSATPSSCVQCHLSSVDLKDYILPSQEKTFASLRDQGLIDIDVPKESKILTLIQMGERDLDKGAKLIHEKTRRAEYQAFVAWIEACCADPAIRDLPPLTPEERSGPAVSDEVIRHSRKSRVVDSFVRNVWSQRMRCFPCHTPHEVDPADPKQKAAVKTLKLLAEKNDAKVLQRLEIFRQTPEATVQYLIEQSRATPAGELSLLNLENPRKSLLVLKPLSKLPNKRADGTFDPPSSSEPTSHLGGLKMHPDDQSYKSFVAWITDYANVTHDRYTSVDQLPADNWHATKNVLRVADAPKEWPVGIPVQLFVHAWNKSAQAWASEPIAFTQGTVTPRHMVNGALFLLSDGSAEWEQEHGSLPRGKYLIKAYVDVKHRLADDPALLLGSEEFYGQAVLANARWREGFRHAEKVAGPMLKKK